MPGNPGSSPTAPGTPPLPLDTGTTPLGEAVERPPVPEALYEPAGDDVVATILTQGPWAPDTQYGGAPCALLTWVVEQVPTLVPMRIARLTFDMHRAVPIARLHVAAEIAREGTRLQVVTAAITHEGVEVARATALRLRLGDGPETTSDPRLAVVEPPVGPGDIRHWDGRGRSGFLGGVDVAEAAGDASTSWYRVTKPIVAGHPLTPMTRLAMIADFTANAGNYLDQTRWSCINPDLSIHVAREPVGEWHAVATRAWYERDGIGHSRADLFDTEGFVATGTTTSLVDETPAFYATGGG